MPKNKFPETAVLDKAITTAYNKIGYLEFCEMIGQEPYWKAPNGVDSTHNQYALEKFQLFKNTIEGISRLGDFWEKIIDWCIENPVE